MNINIKRMSELNKIRDQIRNLRSCIKNDASTIERFKRIGNKDVYYTEQIDIRISKNIEREKEINEFENRMCDVKAGVYDQEFAKFEKISADQIKMNIEDTKQKKDSDIQKKKEEIKGILEISKKKFFILATFSQAWWL